MLDLTEVRFVKRIVVGSDNPARIRTRDEVAEAETLLNRCLTDSPRGSILAVEKSFTVLQVNEHQVVLQWLVYHVGFSRRPVWLVD
ncbi:hypothetical protein [Amantichitinum ursilacus]|uniref:Uncharacterized protein n=1 Tax=Amantichitinum ursilacus TaxID=857265 RepID=A0A0N0XIC0_9NEIS|nr:hypothetical protein [Amantichitinum ursilacus]KPC52580.1 hypothetical protein WG78_12070 [Amantichitinum ursilacus]